MPKNLSVRYVDALRQLPQFQCNVASRGPLVHVLTGARVSPLGNLADEEDTAGIIEIEFSSGHKIQAHGRAYFQMALKEAAEIEICISPSDFDIRDGQLTMVQRRAVDLDEHLRRKHSLDN
ncbi:hypothetical protein [Pseudomonas huanghezhanensis]|uniref:hypothetical protein n=1 Tax=Pseudomonas huanghezhanensis TaxID=3002903 RepID=UPI00228680D9|nr:hypothetical protein [Pseudomonas sp. BSw22131]